VDAMTAPVGEVAANLKYDKGFRDETAKYGAASAAVAGSVAQGRTAKRAGAKGDRSQSCSLCSRLGLDFPRSVSFAGFLS
jgi:hypothetical protein